MIKPLIAEPPFDGPVYAIVPAQPGYFLLTFLADDGEHPADYDADPILAFAIEKECATPITLDGPQDSYEVLRPDGKVNSPFDTNYDTVEDWFAGRIKFEASLKAAMAARKDREASSVEGG